MPTPVMPAGFEPTVAAYSIDEPGGVLRTDVAGGAPRYALDWDRGTQRFSVTLILTALRLSVWTAFYHHIIKKGAITFSMLLDSGFGVVPHDCNIVPGSYGVTRNGNMNVVTFVVEAENQVYELDVADGEELVALYGTYADSSYDLLFALTRFATVDSLVLDF